jgi:methionyl-tRNA formyltransferase
MRLAFLGTPDFAARALQAVLEAGHEVAAVYSQPPAPRGRGQALRPSPVHAFAEERGLAVRTPASLRDAAEIEAFRALGLDAAVVVAFGQILTREILEAPRLGCFNVHASLLPRWRGAAPIVRAIQAGDSETGVCIMKMEAGLDTGPVTTRRVTPILPDDTAGSLHDRLAALGAEAIVDVLQAIGAPSREVGADIDLRFEPQPEQGITYAHKVEKREARIDWRLDARALSCHIRAFDPHPGASSALARQPEEAIRFFSPTVLDDGGPGGGSAAAAEPGEILAVDANGVQVATGAGRLLVAELQRAGGRRLAVADFTRGFRIEPGERLVGP